MPNFIKYVRPIPAPAADGPLGEAYRQIRREMAGVPEPFLIHSPAPDLLLGVWSTFRESLVAGHVRRGLKELVATQISRLNQCSWCVEAHTLSLHATGDHAAARLLSTGASPGRGRDGANAQTLAILQWAAATRQPGAAVLVQPPFSERDAPEFIGTAVAFHYLNRMVNVLLTETPLPFAPLVKGAAKRALGFLFTPWARRAYPSGASLALLPDADLPSDLGWAQSNPAIAGAFARFAAVVERAGARVLSPTVRDLVNERVQAWLGEDPGLSRAWVEQAVRGLDETSQAAARLALLAALASHQIDESVVLAFRVHRQSDEALVAALAWASFTAARHVGTWLWNPVPVAP